MNTENGPLSRPVVILLTAASFVVVIAGLKSAQSILVPFMLAGFIAIVCAPFLFWLKKRGLPDWLALVAVIAVVSLMGTMVVALVGNSVNDFTKNLPAYQAQLEAKATALTAVLDRVGVDLSQGGITELVDPGASMRFASSLLRGLGNALSNAFVIQLTVIFLLLEAAGFRDKVRSALAEPESSLQGFDQFVESVNRYMVIKTWVSLATGLVIALWLVILGVDYPLLWGLLAFLLNYVPNIGSIIAAVPAVLLAALQFGLGSALLVTGGYLAVNMVVGNVVEPRFMGKGLGLSTLVVFVSLVFWGWVFGPVGMLLSMPLTMVVKIALMSSDETRWLAIMMGGEGVRNEE
ncbi:MAG: AI-2E family transporter [Proteobacteria bacterium]|nr:AI-2E family transporter [Pseudomonadota bacterium]MBU1738435.1 AI-2E family transporter [Pseudomonadota bacterium]